LHDTKKVQRRKMIINNWFKDGIMNKNNTKWNSSGEREIMIKDEENISCTELNEKLFFTRTYSLNNSDTYGSPNNLSSATMNSNNIQTINSSGSSSCDNSIQQHLTPKQFLEKYSLPRVIKIIPQEPIADSCGNFDPITLLSGQLLMYKHYNSGKVEARSFPNDRKDYSSLFVIPETYKGETSCIINILPCSFLAFIWQFLHTCEKYSASQTVSSFKSTSSSFKGT
jgi:hypothetical protein